MEKKYTQSKFSVDKQSSVQEKIKNLKAKYHKKILVLRFQQLILIGIIAFLLGGKYAKSISMINNSININNEISIQEKYKWLENHKSMFEKNIVERAKENSGMINFLYNYGTNNYEIPKNVTLSEEEKSQDIPLLFQWDERWAYNSYGDDNIGLCGCGPTCLSMVAIGLTHDKNFTPNMIANYAMQKDYYLKNTGTKWTLFSAFAREHSLKCREINKDNITSELKNNNPVICSMSKGHFTDGGHFILLCNSENNKICVHDPNSLELSNREYNLYDFSDEIRIAWVFEKQQNSYDLRYR